MRHLMLKTCVAGAFALGLFAFGGPASAVSLPTLDQDYSLLIPVMDEETMAVEEDLRPDEVPNDMESEEPMMDPKSEEAESGDIEDEMIDEIGPGAE